MAAPVAVTRVAPAGNPLIDGFKTLVTLTDDPVISFWEKTVKPPGADGGDPINITTMHNNKWRTQVSRALLTLTEVSGKAAYDPFIWRDLVTLINDNTVVTITFPNGDTLAFWGYLKSFIPDDHVEGTQPEATYTIVPTNWDPLMCEESDPVYHENPGTYCGDRIAP